MPSLKPYPFYRKTDLPWLGQIPAHWDVKRLKNVSACLDGKRIPLNSEQRGEMQGEYPYWGANSIVDYVDRWLFDEELVVLGEDGAPFSDKSKDVAFYVSGKVWVNNHAHVLRPKNIEPKFLTYVLNTVDYQNFIDGSTRDKLTQGKMNEISVQYPPLPEQQAIATYLDRQTAKIDALIAKKQHLLNLLTEQRAALISQAVTKGLNPEAKMKDSGVAWLGQVPSHWEVKRMKYISTEPLQYGANESAEIDDTSLPRFIRITDIRDDGNLRDETFKSLPEEVAEPFLLKYGDILFARSGATVGKSFMYRKQWGRACYAGYLIKVRVNQKIAKPEFVSYFANSSLYWDWISSIFIQSTIQNVSAEKYGDMVLPIPPLKEQEEIVDYLDHQTKRLTDLATKIETAIERLQEYRAALISSVVTGKIDVSKVIEGFFYND